VFIKGIFFEQSRAIYHDNRCLFQNKTVLFIA
jgi:hypothetical protein